jgi:hypothetical protein
MDNFANINPDQVLLDGAFVVILFERIALHR